MGIVWVHLSTRNESPLDLIASPLSIRNGLNIRVFIHIDSPNSFLRSVIGINISQEVVDFFLL